MQITIIIRSDFWRDGNSETYRNPLDPKQKRRNIG